MAKLFVNFVLFAFLSTIALTLAFDDAQTIIAELSAKTNNNWFNVGNGLANQGQKLSTLITRSNVAKLTQSWRRDCDLVPGAPFNASVDSQPTLLFGDLYYADSLGRVYSVDAESGIQNWVVNLSTGLDTYTIESFRKSPFVDIEHVYVAARSIFKLNRATGAVIWKRSSSGDQRPGPDGRPVDYYTTVGDVQVVGNKVYLGIASNQNGIYPTSFLTPNATYNARGHVSCWNKYSGALLWKFYTDMGRPDLYGAGADVWVSPGFDLPTNTIFFGTGNAFAPPVSPLSDAIVALDLDTGVLKWSYQFTANDSYSRQYPNGPDFDVNTHPIIFEVVAKRQSDVIPRLYRIVGAGSKDGTFRLFEVKQASTTGVPLAIIRCDPGSNLGGFQAHPGYHDGVLYLSTHASVNASGVRVPLTTAQPATWSAKIIAVDVIALLENRTNVIWNNTIGPGFNLLSFGAANYAGGVVYQPINAGYLRALNSETGEEITRINPAPGANGPFGANLHCGTTITRNALYIGYGIAFSGTFLRGGVSRWALPVNLTSLGLLGDLQDWNYIYA